MNTTSVARSSLFDLAKGFAALHQPVPRCERCGVWVDGREAVRRLCEPCEIDVEQGRALEEVRR